jgi:hypothetical protein
MKGILLAILVFVVLIKKFKDDFFPNDEIRDDPDGRWYGCRRCGQLVHRETVVWIGGTPYGPSCAKKVPPQRSPMLFATRAKLEAQRRELNN